MSDADVLGKLVAEARLDAIRAFMARVEEKLRTLEHVEISPEVAILAMQVVLEEIEEETE